MYYMYSVFILFVFVPIFFPIQTYHNSESSVTARPHLHGKITPTQHKSLGLKNAATVVYPSEKSFVDDSSFVRVYNEGTPEFVSNGLPSSFDDIDLPGLASLYLTKKSLEQASQKRGNVQINLGFNCGTNVVRTEDTLRHDYGATMPQLNAGTMKHVDLFVAASKAAKQLGIEFAQDSFKFKSKHVRERVNRFSKRISPDNVFEGLTIAFLVIDQEHAVNRHVDEANDYCYTETLIFNQVVKHLDLYIRVSLICYLRRSCDMATFRRAACREVFDNVHQKDAACVCPNILDNYAKPNPRTYFLGAF